MKNMWLLVLAILAGIALWLQKKLTLGVPTGVPIGALVSPLKSTPSPAGLRAGPLGPETPAPFASIGGYKKYLASRGQMIAPSGEVCDIAEYNALAATSPTGIPECYMRTLTTGERLLPTGAVRMPSGEIKQMTESLYLAFGTGDPYVKQLEATLGHKLWDPEHPELMSISSGVIRTGWPPLGGMVPGVVYVEPVGPTLTPGVYKPYYHYIDPVTGRESVGVTPPEGVAPPKNI